LSDLTRARIFIVALMMATTALASTASAATNTGYAGPPVEVKLYGHVFDLLNKVPINTQAPADLDLSRNFGLPTVRTGAQNLDTQNYLYLYSTPGLVHYNVSQDEFGNKGPRLHNERGIAMDLELDPAVDIIAYWYMSADSLSLRTVGLQAPQDAGVLPQLHVRATMRIGDKIGSDLDAGDIIARGETVVDILVTPNDPKVYEVKINMGRSQKEIVPAKDAFNVKFEWYQVKDDPSGLEFVERDWELHTGIKYPNRVEVSVRNPVVLQDIHPQFVGDKLVIHNYLNSPLGNYDVDSSTVTVKVEGPSEAKHLSQPVIVQRTWEHNHHFDAVTITYLWDYREDNALPGEYKITTSAWNLQHTAMAEKVAHFYIDEGGKAGKAIAASGDEIKPFDLEDVGNAPKATPGFEGFFVLAALAAVAFGRRKP
jgi:hypothetical protein